MSLGDPETDVAGIKKICMHISAPTVNYLKPQTQLDFIWHLPSGFRRRLELPMEHINCWCLAVFKYSPPPASSTFSPSTSPWLLLGKTVAYDPLLHYNSVNYTRPHVLLAIGARFHPHAVAFLSVSYHASVSGLTVWFGFYESLDSCPANRSFYLTFCASFLQLLPISVKHDYQTWGKNRTGWCLN